MSDIRMKVKLLMEKTVQNGCTEDEAMAAAEKVRQLIEKYGQEVIEEILTFWHCTAYANSLEMKVIERLTVGVCHYCRVSAMYGEHKAGMKFIGPESATVFAEWLVPSLLQYVLRATEEHMKTYPKKFGIGDTKREKLSFALGCAGRIATRMTESSEPWDVKEYLEKYASKQGLKLKFARRKPVNVNASGIEAGKAAGDGARWDRPVNGGGEVRRLT